MLVETSWFGDFHTSSRGEGNNGICYTTFSAFSPLSITKKPPSGGFK
ncbi:Hypothetical protein ABZS17G119_00558 [Kosakonia cowanii]